MRPDENDLVERARQGEVDAYTELVRRHQDQALAAAYVVLGDRHEAEDATQEAFTNAYLALGRFRPGASFRAWLLRIVINEAHDLLAARRRRVEALSRAIGAVEIVPLAASAEAAALSQRRREALLLALFELPEADRLVVTCRYFLDLSEGEIAEILGVARGTVKSRLSRALGRLRPILHDLGPLVVVPPVLDLPHLVGQQIGAAGGEGGRSVTASVLSKFRTRAQHAATFTAASVAAVVVASVVMVSRGRTAPAAPAPPASVVVMGADLSDAERQQVAAALGTSETTEDVSRQDLADALAAQGVAPQPSDAAISSVRLMCGAPATGLVVSTHNIDHLAPAEYASALIIAGLYDGSVTVAAPSDISVSGETALVGLMKALPTCVGGASADTQRVRLAYQELAVVSDMAVTNAKLPEASDAFLDVLNAMLSGQAQDASGVGSAIDAAEQAKGLTLDTSSRDQVITYVEQLRGLDFGPYAHGLQVQAASDHEVRITSAR
ncbi:MAG: DUF1002 domain-containing protein [Chloroflexi bacterium]|nr:DUF1002 domain-containing protein [Chloroflexota bacterium]